MLTEDIKRHPEYTFARFSLHGKCEESRSEVGHFASDFEIERTFDPTPEVEFLCARIKDILGNIPTPAWVEMRRDEQHVSVHVWHLGSEPWPDLVQLSDAVSHQVDLRKRLQRNMVVIDSQIYFNLDCIPDYYVPGHLIVELTHQSEQCHGIAADQVVRYFEYIGEKYGVRGCSSLAKAAQRIIDLAALKTNKTT